MEYYFFLLLPVIIVLAWVLTFVSSGHCRMLSDHLMISFLGCVGLTIFITTRSIVDGTSDYGFIVFDNIESMVALSICPLLFLYIRTVTHDARLHGWYCWLFLPAMLIGAAGTILSIAVGWDRILHVRGHAYAPFIPEDGNIIEWMYRLVNITLFNITLEVMSVVLIGWSIWHLYKYYRHANDFYSNMEDSSFARIHNILMSAVLLLVSIFLTVVFIRVLLISGGLVRMCLSLLFSVLIWIIALNGYRVKCNNVNIEVDNQTSILSGEEKCDVEAEENVKDYVHDVLAYKIAQWEKRSDRPYCKEGLTLVELSKEVGVNRKVLSSYINSRMGVNFNTWINGLRIEHAKHLLSSSADIKIGYVSNVCGYPSQPSFSRAFRKIVGCSPQNFRDCLVK